LTLHRQENVDNKKKLEKILRALQSIDIPIVFPIHPRTKKMVKKFGLSKLIKKFIVIKPLGYIDFLMLMGKSKLVFTDSGGIQVEANILGKPCIVLRDTTEWIRELKGMNILVSDKKELIMKAYKSIGKRKKKINYSKHKGSSKRIIDRCIKLHKKKPLKM
jgi:UDP-N-acetylglucosamine 2-epimerase (non-hydrolysing)